MPIPTFLLFFIWIAATRILSRLMTKNSEQLDQKKNRIFWMSLALSLLVFGGINLVAFPIIGGMKIGPDGPFLPLVLYILACLILSAWISVYLVRFYFKRQGSK